MTDGARRADPGDLYRQPPQGSYPAVHPQAPGGPARPGQPEQSNYWGGHQQAPAYPADQHYQQPYPGAGPTGGHPPAGPGQAAGPYQPAGPGPGGGHYPPPGSGPARDGYPAPGTGQHAGSHQGAHQPMGPAPAAGPYQADYQTANYQANHQPNAYQANPDTGQTAVVPRPAAPRTTTRRVLVSRAGAARTAPTKDRAPGRYPGVTPGGPPGTGPATPGPATPAPGPAGRGAAGRGGPGAADHTGPGAPDRRPAGPEAPARPGRGPAEPGRPGPSGRFGREPDADRDRPGERTGSWSRPGRDRGGPATGSRFRSAAGAGRPDATGPVDLLDRESPRRSRRRPEPDDPDLLDDVDFPDDPDDRDDRDDRDDEGEDVGLGPFLRRLAIALVVLGVALALGVGAGVVWEKIRPSGRTATAGPAPAPTTAAPTEQPSPQPTGAADGGGGAQVAVPPDWVEHTDAEQKAKFSHPPVWKLRRDNTGVFFGEPGPGAPGTSGEYGPQMIGVARVEGTDPAAALAKVQESEFGGVAGLTQERSGPATDSTGAPTHELAASYDREGQRVSYLMRTVEAQGAVYVLIARVPADAPATLNTLMGALRASFSPAP